MLDNILLKLFKNFNIKYFQQYQNNKNNNYL